MEEVTITVNPEQVSPPKVKAGSEAVSPSYPQSDTWSKDSCPEDECVHYKEWLSFQLKKTQKVDKRHDNPGRPCEYCKDKEKIQMVVETYMKKHQTFGEKASIPFIEELAMILERDDETIEIWARKADKDGILEHPELHEAIKRLMNVQKLRLLQRTLGRYNPTGAIFQLKTNHGFMETEKKILAGDANGPLLIELVPERPKVYEDE